VETNASAVQDTAGFAKLEVWKRACSIAVQLYSLLRECRDFGLRDQMQRAAVSIEEREKLRIRTGRMVFFRNLLCFKKDTHHDAVRTSLPSQSTPCF